MIRRFRGASPLLVALLFALESNCAPRAQPSATAPPGLVTISIVGTNDLHGGLLEREGRGGLALLGGYLKQLRDVRARDGGAVLAVDAGDMFQGTLESNLTEGASVVAAYNALGYTAAAVGNHEFDFGPVGPASTPQVASDDPRGALKARAAEAAFPFLAANLIDTTTGQPVAWRNVQPTTVVRAAGINVGIIGLMTRDALSATIAANVGGLSVAPLAETIRTHASALRARGAQVVLVTAHAGGRCSSFEHPDDLSSCESNAEIFNVARELPKGLVDAIVAGHTHAGVGHVVNSIPISESMAGGRAFGRIDLVVDRGAGRVESSRVFPPRDLAAAEYEGAAVSADVTIDRVLAPALEKVRALKARPLDVVLDTPVRRLTPESPLGNLFTDALLASVPGADVALHNASGGLRADLPAGPLNYGAVFEVMPFDNLVMSVPLTGLQLKQVFANHLQTTRRLIGFSGIRLRATCSDGRLDLTMTRHSGQTIGDAETLNVVVSDFLAMGGDGMLTPVIPPAGFPVPPTAPLARDVFADYLKRRGGHLSEEQFRDAANPRLMLPGPLPVTCKAH